MKTKNGCELPVEQITSDNYKVPTGEEKLYHIKQEIKQYNPKTGAKISVPSIQKFGPKVFKAIVERNLRRLGYEIEILHDPIVWMKANAERLAQIQAERQREQAMAQQARKDAEKAAMKAEILAELRESGIIPATDAKPQEQAPEQESHKGPGRPKKED